MHFSNGASTGRGEHGLMRMLISMKISSRESSMRVSLLGSDKTGVATEIRSTAMRAGNRQVWQTVNLGGPQQLVSNRKIRSDRPFQILRQ